MAPKPAAEVDWARGVAGGRSGAGGDGRRSGHEPAARPGTRTSTRGAPAPSPTLDTGASASTPTEASLVQDASIYLEAHAWERRPTRSPRRDRRLTLPTGEPAADSAPLTDDSAATRRPRGIVLGPVRRRDDLVPRRPEPAHLLQRGIPGARRGRPRCSARSAAWIGSQRRRATASATSRTARRRRST
jgi:hypothetical protein